MAELSAMEWVLRKLFLIAIIEVKPNLEVQMDGQTQWLVKEYYQLTNQSVILLIGLKLLSDIAMAVYIKDIDKFL